MGGHIEVFGIGGAGKTTLMGRLLPELGLPVTAGSAAPAGRAAALASVRLCLALFRRAPVAFARMVSGFGGRWVLAKLGHRLAARRMSTGVALGLSDKGLLQPLITHAMYFSGRAADPPLPAVLATMPTPDLAVWVTCDRDVALRRFEAREISLDRLSHFGDPGGFEGRFVAAERLCGELAAALRAKGVNVVEIDVTEAPDDAAVRSLAARIAAVTAPEPCG